ncbi:MAG TPA: porin family protein [Chitinophagaceae bacterium]|nr:porin family protein [Chitinophagaceae bacterium]
MKQISVLILSLLMLKVAKAQEVLLGVKGGFNIADLHYSDNTSTNSKVGVHLGVLAHIRASEKWAVQPEFMYSLEGANNIDGGGVNYRLNYLDVPVLLQYLIGKGFRLEGGPQIDFLLSAKAKTNNITATTTRFQSTGISFPLGFSFISTNGWGVDARYAFGMSNINATKNNPTIQSNVFQFGIFYQVRDYGSRYHHR